MKLTIQISEDQFKHIREDYNGMFFEVLEDTGVKRGALIKSFEPYEWESTKESLKRKAKNEKLLRKHKLGEIEVAVKDYRQLRFRVISIEPEDKR